MQQRFLLQILLLAQHVSGTTMPIIRSSCWASNKICNKNLCCIYSYLAFHFHILTTMHGQNHIKVKILFEVLVYKFPKLRDEFIDSCINRVSPVLSPRVRYIASSQSHSLVQCATGNRRVKPGVYFILFFSRSWVFSTFQYRRFSLWKPI